MISVMKKDEDVLGSVKMRWEDSWVHVAFAAGWRAERDRTLRWVIWIAKEWKVQRDLGDLSGRKRGRLKVRQAVQSDGERASTC